MKSMHQEIFLLVTVVFGIGIIYSSYSPSSKVRTTYSERRKKESFSSASSSLSCKVERMDPWDPSIIKYYKKLPPLECVKRQYDLTQLYSNGTLTINPDEKAKLGYDVICKYRCYDKMLTDDESLNYTSWVIFKERTETNCEFVEVTCTRDSIFSNTVYSNNHNRIIPKLVTADNKKKYSVILFIMDSVSHAHWRRSLPKTYEVLKVSYKSIIFNGMTKVGDNSFPNAVAMLSGLKSNSEFGNITGFYDDHPLIWKNFKEQARQLFAYHMWQANKVKFQGYTTYYAEDYPNFNLFFYLAKGFKGKPVDHYFRPFWLNVYDSYLHRRSINLCYGNIPMHRFQLNYFKDFLQKYDNSPTFAMNWLTELGHDYMNQIQWGDDDISKFFENSYNELKNSFVFVLSDHGHRFDAIRETAIGRKEEQLPFFSMHIPNELASKYPAIEQIVRKNSEKLTSFWDFHATLQDIFHFSKSGNWSELKRTRQSLENKKRMKKYVKRGLSLLGEIPDRTCREAEIPDEYCTCRQEKTLDVNSDEAIRAASFLLSQVNLQIQAFPQCKQLSLSRIVDAYLDEETANRLRIIIEAEPSGALFEGLINRTNYFQLIGDISRVNRYGNQSICVENPILRKFCYCRA